MHQVRLAPFVHGDEEGFEAFAVVGHGVFDLGRDLGVDFAVDDVMVLQFAQVAGEHFFRHVGDELLQFAEAERPFMHEMEQDDGLPFPHEDLEGRFDRPFRPFAVAFVCQCTFLLSLGILDDTTAHSCAYFQRFILQIIITVGRKLKQGGMRTMKWTVRIIQGILAVGFIFFSFMKLSANPMQVEAFNDVYGYGTGFMYMVGAIELVAAIGLIIGFWKKGLAAFFSAVLMVVMTGAAFTHLIAGQGIGVAATPLVLLILSAVVFFGHRKTREVAAA